MPVKSPTNQTQNTTRRDYRRKTRIILFLEKHPYLSNFLIIDSSEVSPNRKPISSYRDTVHRQNLKKLKKFIYINKQPK